ncbi:DUF5753 domain-containing protein [Nocardia sp. CDC153]|uniref:DUF5753 domain-containing protein n=1 Tax=Nocardia sp. CDC153 TaxID=3112167 RepID=UPI002DB896A3|nr:DUF5753 domain-containing protein [Nocardia sp. CDC153]MEC3957176.1 DUF5753 domain-containing protein [Nocardia sp. CDC153]
MQYNPWRSTCTTGLAPLQRSILAEEAQTRLIRTWQPDLVIGLLQTEAYAHAILSACIDVIEVPNDVDGVVATRLHRQRLLDQDGHEFRFLMGEWVLYRTVGNHKVMVEQLTHLLDVMTNPRLSIGIVPLGAEFRAPAPGFVLHDDVRASTELVAGEIVIDDPEGVALHLKTFEILTSQAVFEDQASQLIAKAREIHQSS